MDIKKLKSSLSDYSILYAEDDEMVLARSSKVFENIFQNIETATNGDEALLKYKKYFALENKYYDIVISDINMPKLNGIELSKEIKKLNPAQEILIISAHNQSNILQDLISVGVSIFIHKPIKLKELLGAITKIHLSLIDTKRKLDSSNEAIRLNHEFEGVLKGYDSLIIASRTDANGIITYTSQAFEKISGYTKEELIGQNHNIVRDSDMPDELFTNMWATIKSGKIWKGKIKNRAKNGVPYWAKTSIGPYFDRDGNIIGYNSIREDITAKIKAKELNRKITLLLRHANNGYLLFNRNMEIEQGYSNICTELFGKHYLYSENIVDVLFSQNDLKNKNSMTEGVKAIFGATDKLQQELFVSLLPTKSFVNNKHLQISYKVVDKNNIMVIIKDETEEIRLKYELELQYLHQKMIIQIISNITDFLELRGSFINFTETIFQDKTKNEIFIEKNNYKSILRELHIFKGSFGQLFLHNTPNSIHALETKILQMECEQITHSTIDEHENIREMFALDQMIIDKMVGENYLKEQQKNIQDTYLLYDLKHQIKEMIIDPVNINFKLQSLLSQINSLSYVSIHKVLEKHISYVSYISETLHKKVNELKILGDKELMVPSTFRAFFRNFLHIYKNAIDHGTKIGELSNSRSLTITCRYFYHDEYLFIEVSDDGIGIDMDAIIKEALDRNIVTQDELNNLSNSEKLLLVFKDHLTTKKTANLISGRGIGMSSLKHSCEELNGEIEIHNTKEKGLSYLFRIPMKLPSNELEHTEHLNESMSILEIVTNKVKIFLREELEMGIIDVRYSNHNDLDAKLHSSMRISDNATIIFSAQKSIVSRFGEVFFTEHFLLDEHLENLLDEVSKEMINTIVGLAIQDLSQKSLSITLDTPKILTKSEVEQLLNNEHFKILTILIQTDFGNLICRLVQQK